MSKSKTQNGHPLIYAFDFRTGELKLVEPADKPYEPPPKTKPETPGQIADRLRRQRRHLAQERLAHLQNMVAKAAWEQERRLRSYGELGRFEGADAYQASLYAEVLDWRRSEKVYRQRAERLERWLERTDRKP